MKAWRANGCDFFDTYAAFAELLEYVRAGNGPAAIELDTERYFGHFEGDPQRYRGKGELDRIRAERDCLKAFRARVTGAALLTDEDLNKVDAEVLALIDEAVAEARADEQPDPATVTDDVYAEYA
jgi:TPP-dependent pyruvate/acetoin dehydrogenase alpha subunit